MSVESGDEIDETVVMSGQSGRSADTRHEELDDTETLQESDTGRGVGTCGPDRLLAVTQLGHYRLERLLGTGGMGSVFLGLDERQGRKVAVKVLAPNIVPDQEAVSRFQKEARLLANVQHPQIANLLDCGDEAGTCFLVLEFVDGVDLKRVLAAYGALPERMALLIIRDVAEALAAAHQQRIIHRDIKPSNILLSAVSAETSGRDETVNAAIRSGCKPQVKLTDFGLARHIDQSASLDLTQTGQILGTPIYMAPEQCTSSAKVGPGTDVYALGITLFEMLAGRPPFLANDPVKMISMHSFTEPPDLRKLNSSISDGAAMLVGKMLKKVPGDRHLDAAHLLEDIDRLMRGEANDVGLHPPVPEASSGLFRAEWEWDLHAPPEQLWPLASNTERVNCAVGVPSVEYTTDRDEFGAVRKFGNFRLGWATMKWEEHPFEWIEGRRLGVLREFLSGPFEWFLSIVELAPSAGGGTRLKHTVEIAPRGLIGRLLAYLEVHVKGRKALDGVYERIDAVASGRLKGSRVIDPFAPPAKLTRPSRRRLAAGQEKLRRTTADAESTQQLIQFLEESPAQELARIRPHALARRMELPSDPMTEACLRACEVGLLELHWDILCPTCRISSTVADTLDEIKRHAYCEACDLDFEVDFGNAVELIFRAHPDVREANLRTYCIGGPEHAPHVVAQVRLAADEQLDLDLLLDSGIYVLRGPQLPYTVTLTVREDQGVSRSHLVVSKFLSGGRDLVLQAGRTLLTLENKYDHPLLVRIERTIPRSDVVTAAAASRLPLFRELFPDEVLSPKLLSSVSTSTLLAVRASNAAELFDGLGDNAALRTIRNGLSRVHEAVEAAGGEVVREQDDRLLCVFRDTRAATASALQLFIDALGGDESDERVTLRIALHRGTMLTTTIDGRTDYAGRSVNTVGRLTESDSTGTLVLTDELYSDAAVQTLLAQSGFAVRPVESTPAGDAAVYEVAADFSS